MSRQENITLIWRNPKEELPLMIPSGNGNSTSTNILFRFVENEIVKTVWGYYVILQTPNRVKRIWRNSECVDWSDEKEFDEWEESQVIEWAYIPHQFYPCSLKTFNLEKV